MHDNETTRCWCRLALRKHQNLYWDRDFFFVDMIENADLRKMFWFTAWKCCFFWKCSILIHYLRFECGLRMYILTVLMIKPQQKMADIATKNRNEPFGTNSASHSSEYDLEPIINDDPSTCKRYVDSSFSSMTIL